MIGFRPVVVIPTFDNPRTLQQVVQAARRHVADVIVIDDGSGEEGRRVAEAVSESGAAAVHFRKQNGGKGAAVKDGLRIAIQRGFTHAAQVDADGQHDVGHLPEFLDAAEQNAEALIIGVAMPTGAVPGHRMTGHRFSRFWTSLETGKRAIEDPLCGYRVYPLAKFASLGRLGDRMDFDVEVAVKLVWEGCAVVNLPTSVRYLRPEEGGVSHFKMLRDNVQISWCHTKLCLGALVRWMR